LLLHRRVTSIIIVLAILLFGGLALQKLPVNFLPDVAVPKLLVRTDWSGVNAREVEQGLTERLESWLATVDGVRDIQSVSKQGISLVELRFDWGHNLDIAFLNVREKLDQLSQSLPEGIDRPVVMRSNPSEEPVAVIALTLQNQGQVQLGDRIQLKNWAEQVFTRRLEQQPGIAQTVLVGDINPEVHIQFRKDRLDTYEISEDQVVRTIERANLFAGTGELQDGWYRYGLNIESRLQNLDDIRSLPVTKTGERVITLDQVADVDFGQERPVSFAALNQKDVLIALVKKTTGSNTVAVYEHLKPILDELRTRNPGIGLEVLFEQATLIDQTNRNLLQTLLIGGGLAFLVLFFFLRDRRLPFTIGIAIPTSIMLTFFVMYLLDISINIISLSGLILGIGLLVDNAIVVLENIARFAGEEGHDLLDAAKEGTSEIAMAVTASTLTTISVFLPLVFMGGLEGLFFRDQALTLSISLLASLGVALFILPTLAIQFAKRSSSFAGVMEAPMIQRLFIGYERMLKWGLNHRMVMLGVLLLGLGTTAATFLLLPKQILPDAPPEQLTYVVELPPNTSLETSRFASDQLVRSLQARGLDHILVMGGYTDQTNLSQLAEEGPDRFRVDIPIRKPQDITTAQAIMADWQERQPQWAVHAEESQQTFGSLFNYPETPVIVHLVDTDRDRSRLPVEALVSELREQGFTDQAWTPLNKQTRRVVTVEPDMAKLQRLDISRAVLVDGLRSRSLGLPAGDWYYQQKEMPIRLYTDQQPGQNTMRPLLHQGRYIPIRQVARIDTLEEPEQLVRRNQTPVQSYATGWTLTDWLWNSDRIEQAMNELSRTYDVELEIGGLGPQVQRFVREMGLLLALSVLVIYLILAAQYEHLVYPLIILFAIPFSWLGALLLLEFTGLSLNIFSFLGLLVLTGIAVNDAILKIDFMRRYYEDTGALIEAVLQAGKHRFRPVIMTSITTVMGLLPMVLPFGEGMAYRMSLGVAMIGGMISSTLLTLLLIPVLFIGVQRINQRWFNRQPEEVKS
jgi:HAE1 family hydrophobic/amphiphilic exporter-1